MAKILEAETYCQSLALTEFNITLLTSVKNIIIEGNFQDTMGTMSGIFFVVWPSKLF
ncbi:hypothetical protein [cyanobacterium endosymbiont of Epithemia clementina EcSB]|uniref:hypothetical protein n=1 Tax=cyanobacterium endosymbiont of Epithemia clementina EcSB TaxID=3034674 RepID=UPI0024810ABF|nr:hypothetical protein [cyanobacterium endosymbiont of Epithemia clementina EcSB]WGT68358.1 hypothetical protein P3F56_04755 [cyanobacterium endosymbiont of Epithemia clementina EcSB]